MNINEYLRHFVSELHKALESSIEDLDDSQFAYRPGADVNHIAFSVWHLVRTEDNIVQFVIQRRPTVWLERGLDVAWGLPRVEQGTGMDPEQAYSLRTPSPAVFLDYAKPVWERTDSFLSDVTQTELDRRAKVQPFGEIPILQAIGQTIITHGNQHLGEIWLTRELQGLQSGGL